jgi:outer membrane protein assembly factor BamD (BamD/ComL family)
MKNLFFLILTIGLLSSCGVTKKYEEAKSSKSISLYEDYISKYPRSKYLNQANSELNVLYEERDWKSASQANTITGYERFLTDYPYSNYGVTAEAKIKEIQVWDAWSKSSNINTIYAYENFLNTYPGSGYAFDARNKIEQLKDNLAWKEAESQSTVMSYKKYISEFPNGARKATALDRIREIEVIEPAWNNTVRANTPSAYRDFLNGYSSSSYGSRAREKLSILKSEYWSRATSQKSISQYQRYLDNFPNGEHIADAEKAIIDKEVDNIFKGDHGLLPPMSKTGSGYAYATTNDIEIYNNTSFTLTVRYSGAVASKKIVLKPKQKQKFNLQNGKFRVAASVDAANITNYAGEEKLEGGSFTSEFYIVTERY